MSRATAIGLYQLVRRRIKPHQDLSKTPFPHLHEFIAKLEASLERWPRAVESRRIWTVTREQGESAYEYVALFVRYLTPPLSADEDRLLPDIHAELAGAVIPFRGRPRTVTVAELEGKEAASQAPDGDGNFFLDPSYRRRLSRREVEEAARWSTILVRSGKRKTVPRALLKYT